MSLSFDGIGRVLRHVGRLLLLRADLAAEEAALLGRLWLRWLGQAVVALALLIVGLGAAVAWLTLLLWDRFGIGTLGVAALVLALLGTRLLLRVGAAAAAAPAPFKLTRTAVAEDYEALAGTLATRRDGEAG
jgi:hypothetical protein